MTESPTSRAAVMGLGSIGSRMAARLHGAGIPTTLWNRSVRAVPALEPLDLRRAATPADAAIEADFIILALTDDEAVRGVITAADGVLAGTHSRAVIIDTSTIRPQTAREMHSAAGAVGVGYIDAPLTGGAERAAAGTLTLLCGGDPGVFERAVPIMQNLATLIEHFGPPGSGQIAKAVNQVILAGALLGVAEGVAMAEAGGLDAGHLVDVLKEGAAASWVLSNRAQWMVDRSFPPAGRMALHLKDLKIALDLARLSGQLLPGATLVMGMQEALSSAGYGDEDISALIRYFRSSPQAT